MNMSIIMFKVLVVFFFLENLKSLIVMEFLGLWFLVLVLLRVFS